MEEGLEGERVEVRAVLGAECEPERQVSRCGTVEVGWGGRADGGANVGFGPAEKNLLG